jgi:hypothetical protein
VNVVVAFDEKLTPVTDACGAALFGVGLAVGVAAGVDGAGETGIGAGAEAPPPPHAASPAAQMREARIERVT